MAYHTFVNRCLLVSWMTHDTPVQLSPEISLSTDVDSETYLLGGIRLPITRNSNLKLSVHCYGAVCMYTCV